MSENDHWLLTKDQQNMATEILQGMFRFERQLRKERDAETVLRAAEVLVIVAKGVEPDVAKQVLDHACQLRAVAERLRRER